MVSYPEGSSHSGDKVGDSGSVLGDANAGLPVVQGPGTAVHFLIWRWFFFQCDRVVWHFFPEKDLKCMSTKEP